MCRSERTRGGRPMADVINGDFRSGREALAGLDHVFGDVAGLRVGLRRIEAPHGDELQVTVSADALSVPRQVAVVLANPAGRTRPTGLARRSSKPSSLPRACAGGRSSCPEGRDRSVAKVDPRQRDHVKDWFWIARVPNVGEAKI